MNNELIKLSVEDLTTLMEAWGFPKFRAKQVYEWIHKHHCSVIEDMSNVPRAVRDKLAQTFPSQEISLFERQDSTDGTRKYVLRLSDGLLVETVGMPTYQEDGSLDRLTVCVSSQVGCPMACTFCATGREGLARNLTASEIVQQVVLVQRDFGSRVSNVVVMGQGEPFLNYDEVIDALKLMNGSDDLNIGARHITLSTCGLVEGINRLAREHEQFTLAISLHSARQEIRDRLMPRVSQQPLSLLKESLEDYIERIHRRVSFEYLLIRNVNDSEDDLRALIQFCSGLLCHVNLLPMNAVEGAPYQPSEVRTVKHWIDELERHSIEVSMRKSRGSDIAGACGQLKNQLVSRETT
ncbi:23S rRNA (adenine(2503)-C(2))-methyltransferase RlmN [uncultured Adlercreutzia sp.]|uniref:23S rRNA (adenine(2503)-C(2))-methyltransferase RlmN n=1 Tax=uncultured Adlercreutzia sp. TaxID=875803 RepID=UPI002675EDC7|nr:23S rRNA (adenine(2503)-C(2))-methyltransferase RlmN [uncultured Adlercreutzia sp.]